MITYQFLEAEHTKNGDITIFYTDNKGELYSEQIDLLSDYRGDAEDNIKDGDEPYNYYDILKEVENIIKEDLQKIGEGVFEDAIMPGIINKTIEPKITG